MRNVSEAFSSIHALGVRHGDVRKENILVRDDESVVLIDFERSGFDASLEDLEDEDNEVEELLIELQGEPTCMGHC